MKSLLCQSVIDPSQLACSAKLYAHTHNYTQTHTHTIIHKHTLIYTNRQTGLEKQQRRHIHKTCRPAYMHKCTQMCTDCHRHTGKTHRRKDADTHCSSHFFSSFFFASVCFCILATRIWSSSSLHTIGYY